MTVDPAALRELHRIHRQMTDVNDQLRRGEKRAAAVETKLRQAEKIVEDGKETLTRARVAADEKQLQLKQREARIHELNVRHGIGNSLGDSLACASHRTHCTVGGQWQGHKHPETERDRRWFVGS